MLRHTGSLFATCEVVRQLCHAFTDQPSTARFVYLWMECRRVLRCSIKCKISDREGGRSDLEFRFPDVRYRFVFIEFSPLHQVRLFFFVNPLSSPLTPFISTYAEYRRGITKMKMTRM